MIFLFLRQDLNLDEVLVRSEEGELLKKTLPGDLRSAFILAELIRYHGSLLELGQHHIHGRLTHIVSRVHGGEGRCDNGHESLWIWLVDQVLMDAEAYHFGVIGDLAERDWVVRPPRIVSVVLKEAI